MKLRSAILLMLAGLAGGIGGRLAFHWPDSALPSPRSRPAGPLPSILAAGSVAKPDSSASRPDEAAILTMDGVGEWSTTSVGLGRGAQVELIEEIDYPHSDANWPTALKIWEWAEPGYQEKKSSTALVEVAEKAGFTVKKNA